MDIVAICTLSSGLHAIKHALDLGVDIKKVIGLSGVHQRNKDAISGLIDISEFCIANNLEYGYVDDYTLKSESTAVLGKFLDLLWVCGWQRLIPEAFITAARLGAVGAHGSCDGITKGRGRSPQNWALMIGAKQFEISLFKISPGIDDGAVIATTTFALNHCDTISSSYLKSSIAVAKIISSVCQNPVFIDQAVGQTGEIAYFPKRTPDDGVIDWNMPVIDIHNQIRALADPYPNSFSSNDKFKLSIQRSLPIDCDVSCEPGTVVNVLSNGSFLIAGKDGMLLVDDYYLDDSRYKIVPGLKFKSVGIADTANLIVERFRNEFPNKKINQSLINFWARNGVGF